MATVEVQKGTSQMHYATSWAPELREEDYQYLGLNPPPEYIDPGGEPGTTLVLQLH